MRKGLQLPEPEKVSAMMFQHTLIHSMLKMREEYVGKMHFVMSSYDQIDIFQFGLDGDDKPAILIVTIRHPTTCTSLCPI